MGKGCTAKGLLPWLLAVSGWCFSDALDGAIQPPPPALRENGAPGGLFSRVAAARAHGAWAPTAGSARPFSGAELEVCEFRCRETLPGGRQLDQASAQQKCWHPESPSGSRGGHTPRKALALLLPTRKQTDLVQGEAGAHLLLTAANPGTGSDVEQCSGL